MGYLIRNGKKTVAHIWDGEDTACRMLSTGGLSAARYRVAGTTEGLPVCALCAGKASKEEGRVGERPPALSDRLRDAWKGESRKGRQYRHGAIMELLEEQDGWRQAAEQMLFRAQKLAATEAEFLTNTGNQGGTAERLLDLAADIRRLLGVKDEQP